MHAYAADARDRDAVAPILAVVSVLLAMSLYALLTARQLSVPWWLDAPSVMGFYGLTRALYDKYLWRSPITARLGWGIPDIRGTWVGEIRSSSDGETTIPAVLFVQQSWSKLCVRLDTAESASISEAAALRCDESAHAGLSYEYLNEPKALSKKTMQIHRGSARLRLSPDGTQLTGEYFTGRGRRTMGEMVFHLKTRKVVGMEVALSQSNMQSSKPR
jgi:hypothetical protein